MRAIFRPTHAALGASLRKAARTLAALLIFAAPATQVLAAPPVPAQFADIAPKVQPFVDQGQISGAVLLAADKDHVLFVSAVGESDLATHRKMQTDDMFWIASMSKPITAVAVGILVDQGKLSFDDPVEKYLPEFHDLWVVQSQTGSQRVLVKASRPITLRDLLTHTSGMGEYPVTGPHWTSEEFIKTVAHEPLRFQPGTRWSYSTAGIDTLSRIVEVVSGMPFADFMQQNILNPLGMTNTTYWLSPEQFARYARSYHPDAATGKLAETTIPFMYGGAVTDHARPALGGAGMFSTAEDVVKIYQMMLNNGVYQGHRILKPQTVAEMTRPQTGDLKARAGMPWGLGFCVIADPSAMEANNTYAPGSYGHGGAYGTNSWADPKTGLIHIFMIQKTGSGNPDNSPMRQAYENALAAAMKTP
jgi:CubicO group peptidase (beta-lactamase class C family)